MILASDIDLISTNIPLFFIELLYIEFVICEKKKKIENCRPQLLAFRLIELLMRCASLQ